MCSLLSLSILLLGSDVLAPGPLQGFPLRRVLNPVFFVAGVLHEYMFSSIPQCIQIVLGL